MTLVSVARESGYAAIRLNPSADGLLEARVTANGKRALLLLDTGAARTVFDLKSAARLRLASKATRTKAAGLGTANHTVHAARVRRLEVGPIVVRSFSALVLDLSHVNQARAQLGHRRCDGVLGADFLRRFSALIDYDSLRLFLRAGRQAPARPRQPVRTGVRRPGRRP